MGMSTDARRFPLATLALLVGVIPILAVHAAFAVSVFLGYIDACNPYLDGCTSISRAARHGLANDLFRALMLPYATLLALYWFACSAWLRGMGAATGAVRWLPWLGLVSALFLVLYVTFLGTEGELYRLMRRYGVFVYFGFNFIAQVLLTGRLLGAVAGGRARFPAAVVRAKLAVCAFVLTCGIVNVFAGALLTDPTALQNIMEWSASLPMAGFYLLTWWAWRKDRFAFSFRQ